MKTILTRLVTGLLTVLAATTASATVSVEEIIRLHTAGLSDHSLLLVVSASDTPDTLSTAQLTQMIEAQVPDTVISALVGKADAVMEDWQPVNLEEEMKGRTVYTETEVHYVYPEWGGWYGYGGWGWCGTPWYGWNSPWYGYGCATPYSGLYVGYGWGGGWSVGINFGWGYDYCAPYYAPYYPYYGGGYCGWYDPFPGYDPYPGYGGDPYNSYRVVDRVDYQSGPNRGQGRSAPGTPYRQDAPADTRTELSRMEGRTLTTVDKGVNTSTGKTVRDQGGVPATRSVDDLKRATDPGTGKSTLNSADRGDGRYVIKGDEKQLRENSGTTGRTLETAGQKSERSTTVETPSTKSNSSVKSEVVRGLDRSAEQRSTDLAGRVTERTRNVTSKATGAESVGEQVNRYVKMKEAQRSTVGSRGSRSKASTTRLAEATPRDAASSSSQRSTSTSGSKRQVQGAEPAGKAPAKAAPSTRTSTPKSFSPKSGQRSTGSVGSPSRSGGATSGGGSRSGGGLSRSGGGGSRGSRR